MFNIDFDADRHEYKVKGIVYPSVTQVLEAVGITDYSGVPANILEAKRQIGVMVHRITAMDDEDNLGTFDLSLAGYLESWRRLRNKYQMVALMIEKKIFIPSLGVCGTLDRYNQLVYDGKEIQAILDIKTGLMDMGAVGPQTAAYEKGLRYFLETECSVHVAKIPRFGVKLFDSGECGLLIPCTNKLDFDVFVNAASVVNWCNQKHRRF